MSAADKRPSGDKKPGVKKQSYGADKRSDGDKRPAYGGDKRPNSTRPAAPRFAKPESARAAALRSLVRGEAENRYANLEVDVTLRRTSFPPADAALYTALVYGTLERSLTLDYYIAALSSRAPDTLDPEVRWLLRLGLYQLAYMRVPDHAAVSETVALAPESAKGFVNAILRAYTRGAPALPQGDTDADRTVIYSVPEWIAASWRRDYGDDVSRALCASAIRPPRMTLRVNTLKHSGATTGEDGASLPPDAAGASSPAAARDAVIAAVPGAAPIDASFCGQPIYDLVGAPSSPAALVPVERGDAIVEDAASRLAVAALELSPGMTLADVCAAPGGKSLSAAMEMGNSGRIYAGDLHENKLKLLRKAAWLCGVSIIETAERDARSALREKFDRVLVDAPCSGLGVLAKKPDIRAKKPDDVASLPRVQYAILSASAGAVAPGGVLVYSTCTLRRAENEDVFNSFLASNGDFEPLDFTVGINGAQLSSEGGMMTLFPHVTETDGFFIARARRITS